MTAEEACRAYVAANADIRRLTREIGNALELCPRLKDGSETTHLHDYYDRSNIQRAVGMGDIAPLECEHCIKADVLIQKRKAARRRLGVVKAMITKIGKGKI